jgi:hypothetical protein
MNTLKSGKEFSEKNYTGADPTAALKKLFPEIASQLDVAYIGANAPVRQAYASATSADNTGLAGAYSQDIQGEVYGAREDAGKEALRQVEDYISQQMRVWKVDRYEERTLEGAV